MNKSTASAVLLLTPVVIHDTIFPNKFKIKLKMETWIQKAETVYATSRKHMIAELGRRVGKKTVRIMGFDCTSTDETVATDESKRFLTQIENEEQVRNKLRKANVPFEAVLPKDVFQGMIKNLPFYTFSKIDSEGRVFANTREVYEKRENRRMTVLLITYAAGIILSSNLILFSSSPEWLIAVLLGHCLFGTFFLGDFARNAIPVMSWGEKNFFNFFCLLLGPQLVLARLVSRTKIFQPKIGKTQLWPNKTDELLDQENNTRVTLTMPTPPADAQAVMVQCHDAGIKPYLVVHESAFSFFLSEKDEREMRQTFSEDDPIIVSDMEMNGETFTVIHKQWGEFNEEKELVASIKHHFEVLQEQFLMPSN